MLHYVASHSMIFWEIVYPVSQQPHERQAILGVRLFIQIDKHTYSSASEVVGRAEISMP